MMETRTVTGLASKALDSVLGFQVNAFKPKPFIDFKSLKNATSSSIRAVCKQRGYAGEVPIVNIVEVVGNAVSGAVEKWNKVADLQNHIDREWLRHCVCDLVGGAVTHAVFEEHKWLSEEVHERQLEEEEYLDPAGDDHEDVSYDTTDTVIRKPARGTISLNDDVYYGMQQAFPIDRNSIPEPGATLLPHHQIEQGWVGLQSGEADTDAWATLHDPDDTPASPVHGTDIQTPFRKRSAPSTDSGDSDDDEREVQTIHPKRRRNVGRAPVSPMTSAQQEGDEEDNEEEEGEEDVEEVPQQRKVSAKILWTVSESERLVATRDSGKSWDDVHTAFSNRTKAAIMHKYRTLKDG